jgi:NADH:ubiquinone oxidoreductase subunit 5 (subunit L)/multisubunit Na+/H+ antiporter MnhA subunit
LFFIIHLFSHSFFKRSLFIQRGFLIYFSFGEQIKFLINKNLNIINQRFIINIFCLIGLLFNSGIFSKDFLIEIILSFNFNFLVVFLFLIRVIFTFIYSFNLFNVLINNKILIFDILKIKSINFNRNLIIIFSLTGIYFVVKIFLINLNNLFLEIFIIYFLIIIFIVIIFNSFLKKLNFLILEFFILFFYNKLSKIFLLKIFFIFLDFFIKFFENIKNFINNLFYLNNYYKNRIFIIILMILFF